MLWLLKISIFCSAIIWNWNSYPALRAGSPQQVSPSPNTPKSTPAAFSTLVMDRVALTLRSTRAPVQPTQNRVFALSPSANRLSSRPLVQSPLNLIDWTPAHGCPLDCIFLSISWALSGILLCDSTRFRREQMLFQVMNDLFGRKGLSTKLGGTINMAPTAHGTGIKVKQVLPGKVLNLRYAKGLLLFKRDGFKHHFRSQWFEEGIDEGGMNVQVLGAGIIDHDAEAHEE